MLKLLSRDAEILGFDNISKTVDMLLKVELSDNIKSEISKIKESLGIILSYSNKKGKLNFNKVKGLSIESISSKKLDLILEETNLELKKAKDIDLEYLLLTKIGEESEFLEEKVVEHSDRLLVENDILKILEEVSSWYNEDKLKKHDGKRKRIISDFHKLIKSKKEIDGIINKIKLLEAFNNNVSDYRKQLSDLNESRIQQDINHEENVKKVEEIQTKEVNINESVTIVKEEIIETKEEEVIDENKEFYSDDIDDIKSFFDKCNSENKGVLFLEFINKNYISFNNYLKLSLVFLLKDKGLNKNVLKDYFKKIDILKLTDIELKERDILDSFLYDRVIVTKDKSQFGSGENKKKKDNVKIKNNINKLNVSSQGESDVLDLKGDDDQVLLSVKKKEEEPIVKIKSVSEQGDLSAIDGDTEIEGKINKSDLHSQDNVKKNVGNTVVHVSSKNGKVYGAKIKTRGPIKSKGIILKGDERMHLEYEKMLEINTVNFIRNRVFSDRLENYIIANEEDDIFIYELINRLSTYGSLDIIVAFIQELYRLNLEDEFYATLYENINNNDSFDKEEIDEIEGFKIYSEEERKKRNFIRINKRRYNRWKEEGMQFYSKGEIQIDTEGYDDYSTGFDVDEYMEGRTMFSDVLDDIKNEEPKTMKVLQKASEEVENKELKLEEEYFNKGLDRQFNNILKEKNIEKLYAFLILYDSNNSVMTRKINELLFFSLSKDEVKKKSGIIRKILKILNKKNDN